MLTPAQIELLAILGEECGEVQQRIGKILRFGYESTKTGRPTTNREELELEAGHIVSALALLFISKDLSDEKVSNSCEAKLNSVILLHNQDLLSKVEEFISGS